MKHRAHRASDRAKQSATRRDNYHQLEMKRAADKERSQREIEALEAEAKAESYRKKIEAVANDLFVSDDSDGGKHKSRVKAAGIKSAFYLSDNRGLITTFGQGNSSVPELLFDIDSITSITDTPSIQAAFLSSKRELRIHNNSVPADVSLGTHPFFTSKRGLDLIDCRDQLERYYFGTTFNDNIHIQLIYNILDIEKIISVHINHIIYEINNIIGSSRKAGGCQ